MKTLIVVDMQNDFISGTLGSSQAESIVEGVVTLIEEFRKNNDNVIFTRDTHDIDYLSSQEGRLLPVEHCIKDTEGWQIDSRLNVGDSYVIDKPSFGSLDLVDLIRKKYNKSEKFVLVGLCTDICVISNAMILKAAFPEKEIEVISSLCAGVSVESHENALDAMKMCQILVK